MAKLAWIALVVTVIGMAAAPPCPADEDAPVADESTDTSPGVTTIDELLEQTRYLDAQSVPLAIGVAGDVPAGPAVDIAFEDNSMLGRLRRVRSLSILTLSEQRKSRLFLGVNKEGLLGLHFTASSDVQEEETVEFARLPEFDEQVETVADEY